MEFKQDAMVEFLCRAQDDNPNYRILGSGRSGPVLEAVHFPFRQGAELAREDIEGERAELNTFDFFNKDANCQEHPADLAIPTFDEDDFVPRIFHIFDQANSRGESLTRRLSSSTMVTPLRSFWMADSLGLPLILT